MKKRFVSFVLALTLLIGCLPLTAGATSRTADDAIAWANSKVGQAIDYDGAYGAQCVDLILAYYNYLGVPTSSGNGKDYAWNTLPSSWSRVEGGAPQKGDILVYSGTSSNPYGHVAIYESDYVHYDQNITGYYGVVRCTWHYNYNGNYWGYIRPNWSGSSSPSIALDKPWADGISETSAIVHTVIRNNRYPVPEVGCWVWKKSSGELLKTYREAIPSPIQTSNYIDVWLQTYDEMGLTLEPGTEYDYQFFVELQGKSFTSGRVSFKTAGSAPAKPENVKLSASTIQCTAGEAVTLSFSSAGAEYYQLLRNGSIIQEKLTDTHYMLTLENPGNYSFQIRAVNKSGSTDSNTVSILVKEKEADPVTGFADVIPSDWYYNSVMSCVTKGLFSGVSSTRFDPDGKMTRGMLATVLYRLAGKPGTSGNGGFSDVPMGTYYTEAVAWAAQNNIVGGTGNGKFSPNANITREQIVTMLYRYAQPSYVLNDLDALLQFSDGTKVSAYAQKAMCWAIENRIISGKGDGRLVPMAYATRAEVATILYRFSK